MRKPWPIRSRYEKEAYELFELLARNASSWGWQPPVEALVFNMTKANTRRQLKFLQKKGLIKIRVEKPLSESSLIRTWVTFTENGQKMAKEKHNIIFPKIKGV